MIAGALSAWMRPLVAGGLVLAWAAPALADRIGKLGAHEVTTIPVQSVRERLEGAVLHEDPPPAPLQEGERPPRWSLPATPSRLFGGVVDESRCRLPLASQDGHATAALCRGVHPKAPNAEYVVARAEGRILRVGLPPATSLGSGAFHLDASGRYLGLVAVSGNATEVVVVDLRERILLRWSGDFHDPVAVRVGGDGRRVAFAARIGSDDAVIVAEEGLLQGRVAARGRGTRLLSATADPTRVLVAHDGGAFVHVLFVDVAAGTSIDLSGRKGDVVDGAVDPGGEAVAFTSRIGGVCAAFRVDLITRRRDELQPGVGQCFEAVAVDGATGRVAWVERTEPVRGRESVHVTVWAPRGRTRWSAPEGCVEPRFAGDGQHLALRCTREPGPGTWLHPIPERP